MPEEQTDQATPPAPGLLVVVVGPSGAGKDSLIGYARDRIGGDPAVLFVRRVVTRPPLAAAEDHDSLSPAAFDSALASGAFAVHWEAHGLKYGVPAQALAHVAAAGVAIVNGSRAALPAIRSGFPRVLTLHVTCRPEVLAARLAARGREDAAEQQRRVARAVTMESSADVVEIDNSDDLSRAGNAFVAAIRTALERTSPKA